jgi:hypothetical protein
VIEDEFAVDERAVVVALDVLLAREVKVGVANVPEVVLSIDEVYRFGAILRR